MILNYLKNIGKFIILEGLLNGFGTNQICLVVIYCTDVTEVFLLSSSGYISNIQDICLSRFFLSRSDD